MFKKFAAIAMGGGCLLAVALCLGLLPATALAAAEGAPDKLYVGDQQVIVADTATYWTTDDSGGLTRVYDATDNPDDWNVKYDPNSATLTLNEAKISESYDQYNNPFTAGIYAKGSSNQSVALTIELIGMNAITGNYGIYVDAQQGETVVGTDALLLIRNSSNSSDNGRLEVSGSSHGIYVKSGTGNASLTIKDASVVASSSSSYDGYAGVCVQSGSDATSSPKLSLAVDGGSLTTSASEGNDGIQFYVGAYGTTSATTSLTVTDNAIVDARTGGISADGVNITPIVNIGSTGSTGGIVFDGTEGTVYDDVTLDESLAIGEDETLTIPEGSTLNTNGNLTNNGTVTIQNGGTLNDAYTINNTGTINVENGGTLGGTPTGGTVVHAPIIATGPADQTVTEGEIAEFSVTATGDNLSYQWQQSTDNGQSWTDIDGATGASYATEASTASMSGYQYRCVVSNSAGSATSSAATLTVNEHVHEWVVAWSWEGTKATATFTCEADATHQETPEVKVTSTVKTPATCTEAGVTTYAATVEFDGKTYTDTKDIADIPATGHDYGEPAWSWSEDGKEATATFTCKNDGSHQAAEDAAVTSAVKTPATCTEAGVTTYTATVEFDGKTYTDTKDVADIPAAGHKLTKAEAEAPTCTEPGSAEYWTCGVCGKVFSDAAGEHEITPEDAVIPATGHDFEGGLCSVCGARDTSFSPALVSGDGTKWTKGSSKGLTFVSSAAFADLVEVRLDGRVLSASEYVVREGSTIVTLPAKLLEGLKAGDHELLIVSGSGTVRASLTVAEAAKVEEAAKTKKASADELPANGDSTAPALAVAAAAAAGAGLVLLSRRRAAR